jgi:hypothetical protein
MMGLEASNEFTVLRDERGRWVFAITNGSSNLPTSGVPAGALAYDVDSGIFLRLQSGSWANANLTAGTLTAALAGNVTGDVTGNVTGTASDWAETSTKGATMVPFNNEEEIDMGGADELAAVASTANLIPALSVVLGVAIRCTEAFTGDAANFDVGDETTADRFSTNNTSISLNDTDAFNEDGFAFNAAASKIELLLDDAATAGKVRVSVFGLTFAGATS